MEGMKMYRIEFSDAIMEMEGNQGKIALEAASPRQALKRAQEHFPQMRDVSVVGTAGRYLVEFKVDEKYNRSLFKKAQKVVKLEPTRENFDALELDEQYMALYYALLTGDATFLKPPATIQGALMALKNTMVRQGVVSNFDAFMDYDIAVANAAESQS
jgi:hypothetical protein